MEKLILYCSQYGTSRKYAEKLSELTGIPAMDVKSTTWRSELKNCSTIVYLGGLYAGTVTGLKENAREFPEAAEVIVVTVGIADPGVEKNAATIAKSVRRQLPEAVARRAKLFHLRGRLDYSELSLKHRTMMAVLYRVLCCKPEAKRGRDDQQLIETYRRVLDLMDLDALAPVAEALK